MSETLRVMPQFVLSYQDKSVIHSCSSSETQSLLSEICSQPQSLQTFSGEPQSIVEFYCDDDIKHQTQWGFMDNDQEKYYLEDKETKSGDFNYSDNVFLSMSGCESL